MRVFAAVLLGLMICPDAALADKKVKTKNKEKERVEYYIPEPDALPLPPRPEVRVGILSECSLEAGTPGESVASGRFGIDVSHYQGRVDWHKVSRDHRVRFVYLKATESTSLVDDTYAYNLHEARRCGIPVGAYHFFSPSTPAQQQLAHFLSTVDVSKQDLVPLIDVELVPRRGGSVGQFLMRLRQFVQGVERAFGCKPMIYTGQNFYNKHLKGMFKSYPLMIAKYSEGAPVLNDGARYVIWQFTASGSVDGVRGNVDRSCFMDDFDVDDIRIRKR